MATDLKVDVRREIDRLRKELAANDGRRTAKRSPRGRSTVGPLRRGSRGAMIDWKAVLATLPADFGLDTLGAHETAGEKPRSYLRQVLARWSKEGRIQRTGRGMYRKV